MTRSRFRCLFLAALLGLGLTAGLARADGHELYPPAVAKPHKSAKMPVIHRTDQPPDPQRNPLKAKLYDKPVCCWSHHNYDPICGNLISELRFIFGSCRAFYGEPCLKNK